MGALDLADIQGNIHRPYGRFGFPCSRHLFFNIADPAAGRRFVQGLRPRVTTAEPWDTVPGPDGKPVTRKPPITLNVGFTCAGFRALRLPTRTLRLFPDEFIDGMGCRAEILGDVGDSAPDRWDPIWRTDDARDREVHAWVSLNAGALPDGTALPVLQEWTDWLVGLAQACEGVALLTGHGADGAGRWQDANALMQPIEGGRTPVPKEWFGFTDGISDPVFAGQFSGEAEAVASMGGGKIAEGPYDPRTSWSPLATGEFLLGHADEGQEYPVATEPSAFARNGTFMVWRKLRQDVQAFEAEMGRQAAIWMRVTGESDEQAARETVCAKIVGRWRSGVPLAVAPTWADHQRVMEDWKDCLELTLRTPRDQAERDRLAAFSRMLTGFRFGDDLRGEKCPLGAHIRRANPRDMLDPLLSAERGATTLTNRRRLMRRGLPYQDPGGEVGVVFMGLCASLFRQFEFIQQQWMAYGLDFEAGNDTCPLIGGRTQSDKHVVQGAGATPTFIAGGLPQFVSTRGGDYFFLPNISALRMLAMGTVDPT